ncbi:hypothetical protein M885DRAFT_534370 [Pelagophyceae sp. CCMP2097]|nr:hypothetical protein M885DRAFT_534370 [Pelagophyceae sp. CCMP2097]
MDKQQPKKRGGSPAAAAGGKKAKVDKADVAGKKPKVVDVAPAAAAAGKKTKDAGKKPKADVAAKKANPNHNPMLDEFNALVASWPKDMDRVLDNSLDAERRGELWEKMGESGDALRCKYAWAVPSKHALNIVAHFGPVVEVGGGKGYWSSLLQARGVDAICYDARPPKETFCAVSVGGPEVLEKHSDRALFLCYPDDGAVADEDDDEEEEEKDEDDEEDDGAAGSLALSCLREYEGDTVILVGESFLSGSLALGSAPFGRSADSRFQVELARAFHPILIKGLPRWPIATDCITVWRRTKVVAVVFEKDEEDEDEEDGEAWADIPTDERLDFELAAPCCQHLL